jgi:diguanylate cyclase (GGDEF)-like protein
MAKRRAEPTELDELDLRARIAALETTNAHLATKIAELSFLSTAAERLGATLDRDEIARIVLDCATVALEDRQRPRFLIVRSGNALVLAGAACIADAEAADIVSAHAPDVERLLRIGETAEVGGCLLIPVPGDKQEPALGAIVVVAEGYRAPSRDAARRLVKLAALAGRGLTNARMLAHSMAAGVTDDLTGLFNRRYFERKLADELKRARRLGGRLSVLLFDLDHFKSVNDRHGHQTGDRVLCAVADCISNTVRDIDVVTRWGGEEFAVIAPGSDGEDAVNIAERVRHAVRELVPRALDGSPMPLTISCGIAWVAADIHTPAQCLAAADRCLLDAKQAGRDRVVAVSDEPAWHHQGRAADAHERPGREHRGAARGS